VPLLCRFSAPGGHPAVPVAGIAARSRARQNGRRARRDDHPLGHGLAAQSRAGLGMGPRGLGSAGADATPVPRKRPSAPLGHQRRRSPIGSCRE